MYLTCHQPGRGGPERTRKIIYNEILPGEENQDDRSSLLLLGALAGSAAAAAGSGATPYIYVTDNTTDVVFRLGDMSGTGQLAYDGSAGTDFANPFNVRVDALGRIYVTSIGNTRLFRFDDMLGSGQIEYNGSAGTAFGQVFYVHSTF